MPDLLEECMSLKDRSNDHAWLYEYLKRRRHVPQEPVCLRLFWVDGEASERSTRSEIIPMTNEESPTHSERLLRDTTNLRAVVLCHGQSADVDMKLIALLANRLDLTPTFLRQHLDYENFRRERNCQCQTLLERMGDDDDDPQMAGFNMKWRPARLPSEHAGTTLKIGMEDDCLSFCMSDNVAVIFIRSVRTCKALHWSQDRLDFDGLDYYKLSQRYLIGISSIKRLEDHTHPWIWIYSYARLLLLEYYAAFNWMDNFRIYDPEPLKERLECSYELWLDRHQRCVELENLCQQLTTFSKPQSRDTGSIQTKLQDLATDALSLAKRYERLCQVHEQDYRFAKGEREDAVMKEQLAEAKESKLTATSLGRLSRLAFIYIPPTFVCTLFGMNLADFGQSTIQFKVFIILLVLVSAVTFSPVVYQYVKSKQFWHVTPGLAWCSPAAAFWYAAFNMLHSHYLLDIWFCGIAQAFDPKCRDRRVYTMYRTTFSKERGSLAGRYGNDAFWRDKMERYIWSLVEQPDWNKQSFITRHWRSWKRPRKHKARKDSPV